MIAAELLAKLRNLTLSINNDGETWDERLEWVGSFQNWQQARQDEEDIYLFNQIWK